MKTFAEIFGISKLIVIENPPFCNCDKIILEINGKKWNNYMAVIDGDCKLSQKCVVKFMKRGKI